MKFGIILAMLALSSAWAIELTQENLASTCLVVDTEMDCSNKKIETIAQDAFVNYGDQIVHLNLKDNLISKLESQTFYSLRNLTSLDLQGNKLETLPVDLFQADNSLERLFLGSNSFYTLDLDVFQRLKNLDILDMSNNQIKSINPATQDLSIVSLNLNNNKLPVYSLEEEILSSLVQLESLYVRSNSLGPFVTFGFMGWINKLRFLDLSDNQITFVFPSQNDTLNNLEVLVLTANRIDSIFNSIPLPSLKSLNLEKNKILSIGSKNSFANFSNLEELYLNNNGLVSFDSTVFSSNIKLTTLDLSQNKLSEIRDGAFRNLTNLRSLRLNDNQMISVPVVELYCSKVKTLGMCGNQIQYIDENNCNDISNIFKAWEYWYGYNSGTCTVQTSTRTSTRRPAITTASQGVHAVPDLYRILLVCLLATKLIA